MNGIGPIDSRMLRFVRLTAAESGTHATELTTEFPFRNRFHHCARVAFLAMEIAEAEGANTDVAAVSGLFHDCKKAKGSDHALESAKICDSYLKQNCLLSSVADRIVDCVRNHSATTSIDKSAYPADLAVLKDADLLDEAGAIGIMWTLLGSGMATPKSYNEAFVRLLEIHGTSTIEKRLNEMNTYTGKSMMQERITREQRFLTSLHEELRINQFDPNEEAT